VNSRAERRDGIDGWRADHFVIQMGYFLADHLHE